MPINPSLEQGAFGPEATAAMGEAFDAACKGLRDVGKADLVRELVAKRIMAAAGRGVLDPIRLRTAALTRISHTKKAHRGAESAKVVLRERLLTDLRNRPDAD